MRCETISYQLDRRPLESSNFKVLVTVGKKAMEKAIEQSHFKIFSGKPNLFHVFAPTLPSYQPNKPSIEQTMMFNHTCPAMSSDMETVTQILSIPIRRSSSIANGGDRELSTALKFISRLPGWISTLYDKDFYNLDTLYIFIRTLLLPPLCKPAANRTFTSTEWSSSTHADSFSHPTTLAACFAPVKDLNSVKVCIKTYRFSTPLVPESPTQVFTFTFPPRGLADPTSAKRQTSPLASKQTPPQPLRVINTTPTDISPSITPADFAHQQMQPLLSALDPISTIERNKYTAWMQQNGLGAGLKTGLKGIHHAPAFEDPLSGGQGYVLLGQWASMDDLSQARDIETVGVELGRIKEGNPGVQVTEAVFVGLKRWQTRKRGRGCVVM